MSKVQLLSKNYSLTKLIWIFAPKFNEVVIPLNNEIFEFSRQKSKLHKLKMSIFEFWPIYEQKLKYLWFFPSKKVNFGTKNSNWKCRFLTNLWTKIKTFVIFPAKKVNFGTKNSNWLFLKCFHNWIFLDIKWNFDTVCNVNYCTYKVNPEKQTLLVKARIFVGIFYTKELVGKRG